jgi:hypothetical protein
MIYYWLNKTSRRCRFYFNYLVFVKNSNTNNHSHSHQNSSSSSSSFAANPRMLFNIDLILIIICLIIPVRSSSSSGSSSSHQQQQQQQQLNVVKLPSLYWNVNNRLFNEASSGQFESNYYLKLNAHLGDSIDLVCPRGGGGGNATTSESSEYSIIYKVSSRHEFDNCIINPNNYETVPILKCDKPNSVNLIKFTIYFVKYSPVPNALEFEEDKEYYFLSTSSGSRDGINYMSGGLCSKYNMRFSIRINSLSPAAGAANAHSSAKLNNKTGGVLLNKLIKKGKTLATDAQQQQQQQRPDGDLYDAGEEHNQDDYEDATGDRKSKSDNKQPYVSKLNLVVSHSSCLSSSTKLVTHFFVSFVVLFWFLEF